MDNEQPHNPTAVVIGNEPEALLLSVLFAEAKIPAILNGQFETAHQRSVRTSGRVEAAWLLGVHTKTGRIRMVTDSRELSLQDVRHVIITDHYPTQSETNGIERTIRNIAKDVAKGTNFIFTGLSRPGSTRRAGELIQQFSGLQLEKDFGTSYLPILWNGEPLQTFRERPRILAVQSQTSETQQFLLNIFPSITLTHSFRTAEAAGLFAPIYQDVMGALELELASLCEGEGVDYAEALQLCRGSGLNHLESPRAIRTRYSIATTIAASGVARRTETLLIRTARRVNEGSNQMILALIRDALNRCGRRLRRARVAILGLDGLVGRVETKQGTPPLVQMLNRRGAILSLYPGDRVEWPDTAEWAHLRVERSVLRAVDKTHCAVIAFDKAEDHDINPQRLASEMSKPAAICDLTHVLEASNVERAGLIYTSIGRGSLEA